MRRRRSQRDKQRGRAIEMRRGDDGLFRARTPVQEPGEKIRYYVEMRAADDSGRLAFSPPGASSHRAR